jgi:hypothetical protein
MKTSKIIQHPIVTIDSSALLLVLVLPIGARSFIVSVLNEFLVDPLAPVPLH